MNSALSFASKAGHTEVVEELVTSGASPNTANKVGFLTKYCMCQHMSFNSVPMLPIKDGQTPLHLAVKGGHKSVVEVLLDWGADVNAVDKV